MLLHYLNSVHLLVFPEKLKIKSKQATLVACKQAHKNKNLIIIQIKKKPGFFSLYSLCNQFHQYSTERFQMKDLKSTTTKTLFCLKHSTGVIHFSSSLPFVLRVVPNFCLKESCLCNHIICPCNHINPKNLIKFIHQLDGCNLYTRTQYSCVIKGMGWAVYKK